MSGAAKRAIVVQTECVECEARVHWKVTDPRPDKEEWESLDAESGSSFPCEHWREHHEAGFRARSNTSGTATVGPVTARVLTKPAPGCSWPRSGPA